MKNKQRVLKLVLSGLFLALAYVLPFLTGQIREIGNMLCPMHIPVLLCGFVCGLQYGAAVGFTVPLFRSFTLGMPALFPNALCMALELAAYGCVAGLTYRILPKKKIYIYISLIISMIAGRIAFGVSMFALIGISGGKYTLSTFLAGAVVNAIPGIILQIILIPVLVIILDNPKILNLKEK